MTDILQFEMLLQQIIKIQTQPRCSVKKKCSKKFGKFHRKAPILESLFNKVAGLRASGTPT